MQLFLKIQKNCIKINPVFYVSTVGRLFKCEKIKIVSAETIWKNDIVIFAKKSMPDNKHQSLPNSSMEKWYVFYTKSRAEKKALVELTLQGYKVFVPIVKTIKQWSDRKKKVMEPLLPGYIFIKLQASAIKDVLKHPLIVACLKIKNVPGVVSDKEMEHMKLVADNWSEGCQSLHEEEFFELGDWVEVVAGSFYGIAGNLIMHKGKHKVCLAVAALNTKFIIEVPKSQLKKITKAA